MNRLSRTFAVAVVVALFVAPALAQEVRQERQPDPDSPRYKGLVALQEFLASDGDAAVEEFVKERVAPSVVESMGAEGLTEALVALRAAAAGAQASGGRPVGPLSAELVMDASGTEMVVAFSMHEDDTDRFVSIRSGEHSIG